MPGVQTHDLITVVTGVALAPLAAFGLYQAGVALQPALGATALFVGGHLLSGIMFSPDLDLDSAIDNRWGILFWIWRPYTWAIPHRSFWSHGLVLPPLLRLLYFYAVVLIFAVSGSWLLAALGLTVPDLPARMNAALLGVARDHPLLTGAFVVGFITGAAAHSIADWLVTGGKHYLRSVGIRVTKDYSHHDQRRRERARG
jgi:uncharacterized metal-binding protein